MDASYNFPNTEIKQGTDIPRADKTHFGSKSYGHLSWQLFFGAHENIF